MNSPKDITKVSVSWRACGTTRLLPEDIASSIWAYEHMLCGWLCVQYSVSNALMVWSTNTLIHLYSNTPMHQYTNIVWCMLDMSFYDPLLATIGHSIPIANWQQCHSPLHWTKLSLSWELSQGWEAGHWGHLRHWIIRTHCRCLATGLRPLAATLTRTMAHWHICCHLGALFKWGIIT